MTATGDGLYGERYADWKNWESQQFGAVDGATAQYYAAELARAGLGGTRSAGTGSAGTGGRALEIGFGNGGMLAHLRAAGWQVSGTEASAPLVARGQAAGYDVHAVEALDGFAADGFDLVVAFDVLEHIPQAALPGLMADIRRVLKPGGLFLARFPNGDSPLGLANQHGDMTHLTTIGSGKARFVAGTAGLDVRVLAPPARTLLSRSPARTAYNLLLLPPRWLIEKLVKLLFFPGSDIQFFSSNLVLVAQRPARGPAGEPDARLGSDRAT